MATNTGSQTVTLLYGANVDSRIINRRFQDVRKVGVYSGGYLSVVDNTHAGLSTLTCEISDGTYQVKISTGASVSIAVAVATPYIVLRWSYTGSSTNDYMSFNAVASPSTNDVVVGKCTFTGGGNLQGFDYSERTTPNIQDLFLKVEPTETTELRVRVRAGRVQNGKQTIQISDQKTSVFTLPAANSKVYLVYVNRASGAILIDSSGTAAASPAAPDYGGKLVLAEITLASTATNITAANITDVRDFSNTCYPLDSDVFEIGSSGEISLKSNVTGQSDVASASSQQTIPSSYDQVDSMSVSLTTTGGNVAIDFDTDVSLESDVEAGFQIRVDGSAKMTRIREHGPYGNSATFSTPVHLSWLEKSLSAGLHTFTVYWRKLSGAGTGYMNKSGSSTRVLRVIELPSS